MSFSIGCCVIIALSHPQHANTYGVVIQHTAKFVIFASENCSQESIRVLPKSLILAPPTATPSPPPRRDEARTQDRIAFLDGAEEDQTRTQGQRERDNISYDALPKTANFLSLMDMSLSRAPFDTLDPSSTIASATMMISWHELHQLLR